MKPVPVLVVARRQRLIRMRGQQGRVDVQRDRVGAGARIPHPRPSLSPRRPDPGQRRPVDRFEHPVRRRLRRTSPEQPLLPLERGHAGHAVAAVDEHHRHVPDHPAGIVRRTPLPRVRQRDRQRVRQPRTVGQLDHQRHPRVRDQTLAVRRHFYRSQPSRWLHQLGVLLGRDCRRQKPAFSPPGRTFPPPQASPTIGASRLRADTAQSAGHRFRLSSVLEPASSPHLKESRRYNHSVGCDRVHGVVPVAVE